MRHTLWLTWCPGSDLLKHETKRGKQIHEDDQFQGHRWKWIKDSFAFLQNTTTCRQHIVLSLKAQPNSFTLPPSPQLSVRQLARIKSCRNMWTWCVAAEHYRLIMQGVDREKETHPTTPPPSPFPLHHLFSHQLTFLISPDSHFTPHGRGSSFFPFRSPRMREVCFLIRALQDSRSHVGDGTSTTGLWFSLSYDITAWPLKHTQTVRYCHSGKTMGSAGHQE